MQDGVQDVVNAFAKLRWRRLKLLPEIPQCARRAVPHGNQMIMASEDRCFAVAYPVTIQLGRIGDHIEFVVVDFELRGTLRMHRIVDGQRVKAVSFLKRVKLILCRFSQADPAKA